MVVLLAISRFLLALIVAFFATIFRGASKSGAIGDWWTKNGRVSP